MIFLAKRLWYKYSKMMRSLNACADLLLFLILNRFYSEFLKFCSFVFNEIEELLISNLLHVPSYQVMMIKAWLYNLFEFSLTSLSEAGSHNNVQWKHTYFFLDCQINFIMIIWINFIISMFVKFVGANF